MNNLVYSCMSQMFSLCRQIHPHMQRIAFIYHSVASLRHSASFVPAKYIQKIVTNTSFM